MMFWYLPAKFLYFANKHVTEMAHNRVTPLRFFRMKFAQSHSLQSSETIFLLMMVNRFRGYFAKIHVKKNGSNILCYSAIPVKVKSCKIAKLVLSILFMHLISPPTLLSHN